MGTDGTYDRDAALTRLGGDHALYQRVVEAFLGQTDALLEAIAQAVASKDAASLDRAAHALKGAVANFGAERVGAAAARLEAMGRSEDLTEASTTLQTLEVDLTAFVAELETDLAGSE